MALKGRLVRGAKPSPHLAHIIQARAQVRVSFSVTAMRYIIARRLSTTMKAESVTDTLDMALQASGYDCANIKHRPRLLSDNGPSYIAEELADYSGKNGIDHVRGAPFHPQTQGKIERWHQTLKNRVLLENYFPPGDLERQIKAFVEHYNHQRYHESLNNVTPADT